MKADDCELCFYCQLPISQDHEHDHAPIPVRHGGTETVPTCIDCHNLKDRIPLRHWPVELMVEAINECGPMGRILLAKSLAVLQDARAAIAERAA